MRCNMSNVAVIAVAAAALMLMTAETVVADGGGSGSGSGGGGGGGSGGEQQRGATAAAAADRQDMTNDDNSPRTPSAVQCSSCLAHEGIKSLSIELIKASILNKLGMQRPPEFGDRRPPKVPTDLPPLQDLMKKYNTDRDGSVVVLPHIRHKTSRHYEAPSGIAEMQSDEAATTASENGNNNNNSNNNNYYSSGNGEDEEDDYHLKTHKLIAFAQIHPTTPKNRGHYLLYFTFSEQTGQHRITEAILWVYKKKSELVIDDPVIIIDVYRINPVTLHQTKVSYIKRVINTTEPGWVPIDLRTRKMADWFRAKDGAKNLTLAVHACYVNNNMTHVKTPYVTDARKRDDMTEIPYLEVHTEDARRSRSKRNVLGLDCNENSKEPLCCRYPLEVDFEAFGWDWIIAPKRYEANFCSGECPMVFLQRYPHTHLAQMVNQMDNKTTAYSGTGPCCSPRKLSAISMLYFDQDYNIVYGVLPGMVVDRCGCM